MTITTYNPDSEPKRIGTIDQEQLWRVKDVANYINVKESVVYGYTRQKGPDSIPRRKVGRNLRFVKKEIDIWLNTQHLGFKP